MIWGDDIGGFNISAYNRGMMGYRTPNIDRIASEGVMFTDWYGQQSCTTGRAAFITGQSPIRTGLTKVGLPGAPEGMKSEDPTIAELLKPLGYATGQFGKNDLGDRDERCRPITASMSFSAISTTSTRKKSRRMPTIRRTPNSRKISAHAASSIASLAVRLKIPAR